MNEIMIVSIHQPAYLPWLGYFHKIALSDIFVYLDTTQFEKNSFINRNKIKTSQGENWLTVPVKLRGHMQKEIKEIKIEGNDWQEKHWRAMELNYKKARYWEVYSGLLKKIYQKKYSNISDLCYEQMILFLKFLKISTKIVKASDMCLCQSVKENLVLDICCKLEATVYVSGILGKDYLLPKKFSQNNIKIYFQDYQHPTYKQLWSSFIPQMSIIDLLFNEGDNSLNVIMRNNINKQDLLTIKKL